MNFLKILKYTAFFVLLFSGVRSGAQTWLPDFRYRKKITIVKNKVAINNSGLPFYTNFPVLVEMEHEDLRYIEDVFKKTMTSAQGLDIFFSSVDGANTPLKFQMESYHAATGKLVCWVILPSLYTKGSDAETAIYLYYGSTTVFHDPALETMWQDANYTVQHFNEGADGKISSGRVFNGLSDQKVINSHSTTAFTLTAWIKLDQVGKEQMIVTNDSIGIGGYQLKVNSSNKLVFLLNNASNTYTYTGKTVLGVNEWHYVTISYIEKSVIFMMDGVTEGSISVSPSLPDFSGQVIIGASNVHDRYFKGIIDEFRIGKGRQVPGWFLTAYENQQQPAAFITVQGDVMNPSFDPPYYTFVGTRSSNWMLEANWMPQKLPGNNKNVIIKAGVTADVPSIFIFNNLRLETGAKIILRNNTKVLENLDLNAASAISFKDTAKVQLQLEGNVINNGNIALAGTGSKILFSGNTTNAQYTGTGTTTVDILDINKPVAGSMVMLAAALIVKKSLNLIGGELRANGHLVLLVENGRTAVLNRVLNQASITGNVQVQSFVDGSFPSPATGRGWRLLSSPVFHVGGPGYQYQVQTIKNSIFVTGKGGLPNGFDASPNNGATIYTHNQSLPGSLAQKYVPIPGMQVQIPVGTGFFVYSRGSRLLPNAYQNQIQAPPFANAAPYILTYTGRLFTGDLMLEVFNSNKGEEGDGFNLMGNPYAAPIKWGSLEKINVGPFIWVFDPLNNNYTVTDNPEQIILPGEGFFIKVNQGSANGFIGFKESSKINSP